MGSFASVDYPENWQTWVPLKNLEGHKGRPARHIMDRLTDEYPTQPQKRVMILKGWQKWLAEAPYAPPTGWYIDIEGGFAVGTGDTTTRLFGSEYVGKLSGVCLNDFRFTRPSDIRKLLSKQAFAADLVNRRTENMAALFSRSDPFGEK